MTLTKRFALAVLPALGLGATATAARAAANDPLFVMLTSDDAHRATMALTYGENLRQRGHGLTVFLNDRGVLIAMRANSGRFGPQQQALTALAQAGATVLVCPMCLNHFGGTPDGLVQGMTMSNPDLMNTALFRDGVRTLCW